MKILGALVTFFSGIGVAVFVLYSLYNATENQESFWDSALETWGSLVGKFRGTVAGVQGEAESFVGSENQSAIDKATSLIAGFEKYSSKPYQDPKGQTLKYSIGYGHQVVSGDPYWPEGNQQYISESDAWALLEIDVAAKAECVFSNISVPLNTNQSAALISLCYNIGCSAFQGSTLARLLNAGDYDGAMNQFAAWRMAGGQVSTVLEARRGVESTLFNA